MYCISNDMEDKRNTLKEKKKKNKRFPYKKGGRNRSNLKVVNKI